MESVSRMEPIAYTDVGVEHSKLTGDIGLLKYLQWALNEGHLLQILDMSKDIQNDCIRYMDTLNIPVVKATPRSRTKFRVVQPIESLRLEIENRLYESTQRKAVIVNTYYSKK